MPERALVLTGLPALQLRTGQLEWSVQHAARRATINSSRKDPGSFTEQGSHGGGLVVLER